MFSFSVCFQIQQKNAHVTRGLLSVWWELKQRLYSKGEKSDWHSLGLGLILTFTGGTAVPVISVCTRKQNE